MSTPELYLETSFHCDDRGRIVSTREPEPKSGHWFCLVRSASRCAWRIHAEVRDDLARTLDQLAHSEPPSVDFRHPPVHANEYRRILEAHSASQQRSQNLLEQSGPAMTFPEVLPAATDVVRIEDERLLAIEFPGWTIGEIAGGRAPVLAVIEDDHPVSVCFCARTSPSAAEAGLDTAERYRGRGLGPRVTAAWARALRAEGRVPLYSTQWTNHASLAVARTLGLRTYASTWTLREPSPAQVTPAFPRPS